MEDPERVSQASSVATISYFPVRKESLGKVQAFGKRCQAAKRDPNCPVVIRGWLNKKDSSGLKLWKRRWFVLSNYCLFYYKDSREESVLGSIPLPSYKILLCSPRECKNRKFTFKVVHQGMRSYFFSADTQEDMLGWVRALSQSAAMDPESSMNRRCTSYQDFTQIRGSSESVDFPKAPSDGEGPAQKHRHVSRTLSEPSQLSGGRMGESQRGRRRARHRNSSPSDRTPSPPEFRRRAYAPHLEEDCDQNTPLTHMELMGMGSLTSRGHLGSRPHTPVGRVDIRPHDDLVLMPQTLYYTPSSPKLEFKSTPTTPGSERWQNLNKPTATYGSVHHPPSGRRLAKRCSAGAQTDLLPPLPPLSRAAHAPHPPHHHHHHHHHRSHVSVCVLPPAMAPKPDPRETPPIRPLESDADTVLTRLCGCDKLLQSLSVELAQLQMDKDSVQCALEVSRLQLDEWQSQGPRALDEALTHKALLQEDLVTIRARMCDVSLEMERVWSQYERMESELSVIRSHLQHICNFGMPQDQSQAQRELWMMEDILAGLKVNRDHFRFLLGLQRHHMFQSTAPHSVSPGSPAERQHSDLTTDVEQEPPVRPALPRELLQSQDRGHGYTESPYEGFYSPSVEAAQRRGRSHTDRRDASESQPDSSWNQPDTTKNIRMSEEEQIERMKRNQERLSHHKKPPIPAASAQSQGSEPREAPFPLRVTRVVTAVLPSSLVARRVSVEDPPAELDNSLPEQIPPEQSKTILNKLPRHLLLESPDNNWSSAAETHQDQPVKKTSRQQYPGALRSPKKKSRPDVRRAESTESSRYARVENGRISRDVMAAEQPSAPLTSDMDLELCLTPEQREAKLRRVKRIRERVIQSAVRESVTTCSQVATGEEGQEVPQMPPDKVRKQRIKSDSEKQPSVGGCENCEDNTRGPAQLQLSSGTSQDEDDRDGPVKKSQSQCKFGDKTKHNKDCSGRTGVAKARVKRPVSPYHISSMTVYQKDGGKGFVSCKVEEEKTLEEPSTDDSEAQSTSSDLRAKWFLSTNHWQGFIPLQMHGIESLCGEEMTDREQQPACSDDATDSGEMSSTVCESLEKMKENHSLFYKIACDISISDTDITKNDGNTNVQSPCGPEEEELLITEYVADDAERRPDHESSLCLPSDVNESSISTDDKFQSSTVGIQSKAAFNTSPAKETHVLGKIQQKEREDTTRKESLLKAVGALVDVDSEETLDEYVKGKEQGLEKESEDVKMDQERCELPKESHRPSEENKETVQEQCNNNSSITPSSSVYKGKGIIRSASFGKARVTVIRTSL
ncbi:pleckstrin homology domain-containing family A member 7 isoform X2 [Solea solea]|nr:pleckstrin homology domain-containing family A member 7 isoform X2 [Solea solea]